MKAQVFYFWVTLLGGIAVGLISKDAANYIALIINIKQTSRQTLAPVVTDTSVQQDRHKCLRRQTQVSVKAGYITR